MKILIKGEMSALMVCHYGIFQVTYPSASQVQRDCELIQTATEKVTSEVEPRTSQTYIFSSKIMSECKEVVGCPLCRPWTDLPCFFIKMSESCRGQGGN